MAKRRTNADIDREIAAERKKHARYMLIDEDTGAKMREAHDFEIKQLLAQGGRGYLTLGGGWKNPERRYSVRLELMGVHQPTRQQRKDPRLPKEKYAALDRNSNVVATSDTIAGAMSHADTMAGSHVSYLTVKGEYTSDGHHWGLGKGRVVATRESGKWLRY